MSNQADISRWEDEELEFLDKVDVLKQQEADLKSRIAAEKNSLEEIRERVRDAGEEHQRKIGKLTEKKNALRKKIAPDVLSKFDQIANSKGERALAKVKNRICRGCYTQVPKQLENELMRAREPVFCHSCGRILMRDG